MRPVYTGWFAEFGALGNEKDGTVNYADNGQRFAGATIDFSPLYRLIKVLEWLERDGITIEKIHDYVGNLQRSFLIELERQNHPELNRDHLLMENDSWHGNFLTFKLKTSQRSEMLNQYLKNHRIITDYRGDRLRFGFALYHNPDDYDLSCLKK